MARLWLLLFCLYTLPLAAAPAFTAQSLLALLAKHAEGTVHFTESKYYGVLDVPLDSSGTLHFRAPDFLEKHTTAPKDERLIIEGSQMRYQAGGQTIDLNLNDQPGASVYADSLKNLLNGNYDGLDAAFYLQLTGDAAHWSLTLRPKQAAVQSLLRSMTVDGSGQVIERIAYDAPNGDHSVLTLKP